MKTTHRDYSEENGDFHRLVHYHGRPTAPADEVKAVCCEMKS